LRAFSRSRRGKHDDAHQITFLPAQASRFAGATGTAPALSHYSSRRQWRRCRGWLDRD
jgi:hypothetical protein